MENYCISLNEQQLEAMKKTEGYVRVIAGAGSGKTRVLTHRYAYLVNELGIATENILCVTFTNKAAQEMRQRIRKLIGDKDTSYITTFHGYCVQVLREDIHVLNYPKEFVILDNEDQKQLIRKIYNDCNLTSTNLSFKKALDYINETKAFTNYVPDLVNLDENKLKSDYENAKKTNDIYNKILLGYFYEQKKCYGLDFNDLIKFTFEIFAKDDAIRNKWQQKFQYIMVDEFQDVSSTQYGLVSILSDFHKNLFIVGDPDQTIYSWRGANPSFLVNFDRVFQNVKTIMLERNYRSTPNILDVANSLIKKNKYRIPKNLYTEKEQHQKVLYCHHKTAQLEAQWIIKQIKFLLNNNVLPTQIAILYRMHNITRPIEEELMKNSIPYIIYSGVNFYERKEIKDVLAYLRFCIYEDDLSFERIINTPRREIGKTRLAHIKEYAENNNCSYYEALKFLISSPSFMKSGANDFINLITMLQSNLKSSKLSDFLVEVLSKSGYEELLRKDGEQERLDNLAELKQSILDYENSEGQEVGLIEYLQKIALLTNLDKNERKNKSVKLMTVHTAKGLEFPCVFLCGFSEGIFPSSKVKKYEELEEERRLAYVAITRAENLLFISDAEGNNYNGSYRYPSRFIFNIDKNLLSFENEIDQSLILEALNYININEKQLSEKMDDVIPNNTKVLHKIFGNGVIIEHIEGNNYSVKFDNFETTRTISKDKLLLQENNETKGNDKVLDILKNFLKI